MCNFIDGELLSRVPWFVITMLNVLCAGLLIENSQPHVACVLQHDYIGDNLLATRGLVHSRNAKLLVSDLEFSVLIMPFSYLESHSVSCW